MEIRAVTDISNRKNNQDNYWYAKFSINGKELGIACVCDGMGGLEDGEKASRQVISDIRDFFLEGGDLSDVGGVLENSNLKIKETSEKKSGTTCVIVVCCEGKFEVVNVGDSRCYHARKVGTEDVIVMQITEDHTAINKFKKEGRKITEDIKKKYLNVLSRCVGASKKVVFDRFDGRYFDGDIFIVCSDGFWHTLTLDDFRSGRILDLNGMVEKCKRLGESDNITVCMIQL